MAPVHLVLARAGADAGGSTLENRRGSGNLLTGVLGKGGCCLRPGLDWPPPGPEVAQHVFLHLLPPDVDGLV